MLAAGVYGWALGPDDRLNEPLGGVLGHRGLDQREHLALLEAHVPLEHRPELMQRLERLRLALQVLRGRPDVDVIDEHAHDAVGLWVRPAGGRREQDLLLDLEVPRAVLVPESQELLTGRLAIGRAAQSLRGHERHVMVTRQRLQGAVTLHR